MSRLESGVVETHPEWMNLLSFLEDLDDLFRTRFRRRGLEFLVEPPTGPVVELWIDPGRLSQILNNLLSNALRFTKRGWVALRVVQRGSSWEFSVEDSESAFRPISEEPFLSPSFRSRVRSRTTLEAQPRLAICRTLAQSLDGRLGLESDVGSGSRFTLTFDHLQSRQETKSISVSDSLAAPEGHPPRGRR